MNKIITVSALSLTLLIHNAYGMHEGQTASLSPLSRSRSSSEGSTTPLDKVALLRNTPLDQVQVINFDPESTLTDDKKRLLVASLLSIQDAVTVSKGKVIIDASKTYVFPPTTSDDESSEQEKGQEHKELEYKVVNKLTALKQARLSDIDLVGLEDLSIEEQQSILVQKDKIVESLRSVDDALTIVSNDRDRAEINITKIVSYPLKPKKSTEPKETAKTETPKIEK